MRCLSGKQVSVDLRDKGQHGNNAEVDSLFQFAPVLGVIGVLVPRQDIVLLLFRVTHSGEVGGGKGLRLMREGNRGDILL